MALPYTKSLEVVARPDVMVCGAGCAGTAAAVAAARTGASVLVAEQWLFAGGNITAASVNGVCGLADMITGELVVAGIPLEILHRTGGITLPLESKYLFKPVTDGDLSRLNVRLPFSWDMEQFKHQADRMFLENGVTVLYHTKLLDVLMDGDRIAHVVVGNKGGVQAIEPRVVVDCTGDGDIAAWAGVPTETAVDLQAATLEFYLGGVTIGSRQDLQNKCAEVLVEARRRREIGIYGGPWLSWPAPGCIRFNAVRILVDVTDPGALTAAEMEARHTAWTMYDLWKKNLPEFAESYFWTSGPALGARETRRIQGVYTLTKQDIVERKSFEDAVVFGAWYLDRHPADAPGYHPHTAIRAYGIPYRTLVPVNVRNLLVAGRCHSATTEALASTRVGFTAIASQDFFREITR